MGGDACLGVLSRQGIAPHQSLELLLFIAIHQPDLAAEIGESRFEQQGNHQHDGGRIGVLAQAPFKTEAHLGMDQVVQPLSFSSVSKNDLAQGSAVNAVVPTANRGVALQHGLGAGGAGFQHRAGELIRIQHRPAARLQQPADTALAAGDPSG